MKAVVADLDGTLLRNDKSISSRTHRAIDMLKSKGVDFIIATARPPRSVFQILPLDFTDQLAICYNGAEIYHGRSRIYEKSIQAGSVKTIILWLEREYPGIRISVEINNNLYANFDINIMND
jgi:5-amino-6-(5-phospho-D-ribitylamino)uracil phosphatase